MYYVVNSLKRMYFERMFEQWMAKLEGQRAAAAAAKEETDEQQKQAEEEEDEDEESTSDENMGEEDLEEVAQLRELARTHPGRSPKKAKLEPQTLDERGKRRSVSSKNSRNRKDNQKSRTVKPFLASPTRTSSVPASPTGSSTNTLPSPYASSTSQCSSSSSAMSPAKHSSPLNSAAGQTPLPAFPIMDSSFIAALIPVQSKPSAAHTTESDSHNELTQRNKN